METRRHSIAALATLFLTACGPDLSQIRVSECMHACNDTSKLCLDKANGKAAGCSDSACMQGAISDSETCLTVCLDCIDQCVADMEKTLK